MAQKIVRFVGADGRRGDVPLRDIESIGWWNVDAIRSRIEHLGAWTPDVERKVREFDEFRLHGTVPKPAERGLSLL